MKLFQQQVKSRQKQLRVLRFTNRYWEGYQLLQERRWWGWNTIDRENVPNFVAISIGAVGDPGSWVSKFAKLGTFSRKTGGLIIPHQSPRIET